VPEALASSELIIGWSAAQGLTDPALRREQFRDIIHQTYHSTNTSLLQAGIGAGSVWRFIREMTPGDLVVVPHRSDFYVARVTGAAYHDSNMVSSDTAHRRPVQWLNQGRPLPRSPAPLNLMLGMYARQTCVPATHLMPEILGLPIDWGIAPSTSQASDLDNSGPATRFLTETYRVLRDTALARTLKSKHDDRCQICGLAIKISEGKTYSEAHHIQPLGKPHNGPDVAENILVLCPNHHAMCDYGALKLRVTDLTMHPDHPIGERFIQYHNNQIAARAP
jgi:hypothetical protein